MFVLSAKRRTALWKPWNLRGPEPSNECTSMYSFYPSPGNLVVFRHCVLMGLSLWCLLVIWLQISYFPLSPVSFFLKFIFSLLSWCMVRWTVHLKKFLWSVLLIVQKLHHHFSPLCLTRLLSVRECIFVFALSKSLLFKIFQTLLIFMNFFKTKDNHKGQSRRCLLVLGSFFLSLRCFIFFKNSPFPN